MFLGRKGESMPASANSAMHGTYSAQCLFGMLLDPVCDSRNGLFIEKMVAKIRGFYRNSFGYFRTWLILPKKVDSLQCFVGFFMTLLHFFLAQLKRKPGGIASKIANCALKVHPLSFSLFPDRFIKTQVFKMEHRHQKEVGGRC